MPLLDKYKSVPKNDSAIQAAKLSFPKRTWFLKNTQDLRAGYQAENLFDSLSYAYHGLVYAFNTQRNFRIHLVIAVLTIGLSSFLPLSLLEWALVWGCIGLVLFAELLNTVVELLVDMFTQGRYDPRAKAIKDMAAGAVFITVMSALACGICIFVPHFVNLL